MSDNYAVIEDGVVVNVIVWDGKAHIDDSVHESCVKITGDEWIGWAYDGNTFSEPVIEQPITENSLFREPE